MDTREVFKRRLRELLIDNDKTQIDLAKAVGVSSATVSEWVNGKKMPRIDKVDRIAEYLGASRSYLLTESSASEDELSAYLEELKTRPEMRMLFSLAAGASKADVEKAVKIIEAYLGK